VKNILLEQEKDRIMKQTASGGKQYTDYAACLRNAVNFLFA